MQQGGQTVLDQPKANQVKNKEHTDDVSARPARLPGKGGIRLFKCYVMTGDKPVEERDEEYRRTQEQTPTYTFSSSTNPANDSIGRGAR